LDGLDPGGRFQLDHVAFARLQERARDWRDPADAAGARIRLVDADDGDAALGALAARIAHGRAEEHLLAILLLRRIDHLGDFEPLGEKAQAAIDLAQALLAVDVIAVLRAIAIARGPGDGLDDLRPLDARQVAQLLAQPREAFRRDVVLGAGRQGGPALGRVLLGRIAFSGESLAHRGAESIG